MGEVIARTFGLLIPGPVIGMTLFVLIMIAFPKLAESVRSTAMGLLAHLSLLFVPAGVGVVSHIQTLSNDLFAVILAIVISTIAAIVVAVYVFILTSKLVGQSHE